jgi:exosome complex RNA-binding protein Csl4
MKMTIKGVKKISKANVANRCTGCGSGMVRDSIEYYCPKCGLTEEISIDGV